ncbi:MAG: MFS transporter [Pseudomonadales bacterium]|nr:MFS transporter [Pseudomonadales bacterium]
MTENTSAFRWYMAGAACQFIPFGIHNVLYAWLLTVQLGENGVRLGIAQMCVQIPGLVLMLFSGLLADRADRRRILMVFHCLAAVPAFSLALAVHEGYLSYMALLAFALVFGTCNTFLQPARDSLLNQVAPSNLQRAVTLAMGLMFASQIVGYAFASQADVVGAVPLLVLQGCFQIAGALFVLKLPHFKRSQPSLEEVQEKTSRSALGDITEGLKLMFRSDRMAPVMVLMLAIGLFYSGAFFVINPLVVRDVYGGDSGDIALSYVCFMVGTIFTTVFLVVSGGVRRQGRGLMVSLLIGGGFLTLTVLELPFWGYLACLGIWGMGAGVSMSLGRAIVQETAPDDFRARALSVYSLGNLGAMPIGSVLMGFLAMQLGPLNAYAVSVIGVYTVVAVVWLRTELGRVDRLYD